MGPYSDAPSSRFCGVVCVSDSKREFHFGADGGYISLAKLPSIRLKGVADTVLEYVHSVHTALQTHPLEQIQRPLLDNCLVKSGVPTEVVDILQSNTASCLHVALQVANCLKMKDTLHVLAAFAAYKIGSLGEDGIASIIEGMPWTEDDTKQLFMRYGAFVTTDTGPYTASAFRDRS